MPAILSQKERITLRDLKLISLHSGGHNDRTNGLCVMEVAAWMAGEPHSDKPQCVCPVIAAFLRSWNDSLPTNEDRDRLLKPLAKPILNTKATREIELTRAMLCVDWSIRVWLPEFLSLTPSLATHASALRAAKPIQDWQDFDQVAPFIVAAQKDAADARAAAGAAAWADARADARAAAWDAARAAAWAAAGKTLAPTVSTLQASAVDLVKRMCAVK